MPKEAEKLQERYALGLPQGSVRAMLALLMSASIWCWMRKQPNTEIPDYLQNVLFIILGHYFVARHNDHKDGPPPLWLPRGTIRCILMGGFLFTGYMLYKEHHIVTDGKLNHAGLTLVLVGTFILGVLIRHIFPHHKIPIIVQDIEALTAIGCAIVMLLLVFQMVQINSPIERLTVGFKLQHILAAFVGFYFGTKS